MTDQNLLAQDVPEALSSALRGYQAALDAATGLRDYRDEVTASDRAKIAELTDQAQALALEVDKVADAMTADLTRLDDAAAEALAIVHAAAGIARDRAGRADFVAEGWMVKTRAASRIVVVDEDAAKADLEDRVPDMADQCWPRKLAKAKLNKAFSTLEAVELSGRTGIAGVAREEYMTVSVVPDAQT